MRDEVHDTQKQGARALFIRTRQTHGQHRARLKPANEDKGNPACGNIHDMRWLSR
jgi:hypothetical protein